MHLLLTVGSSEEHCMSTSVPLLDPEQLARLPERAREVVEYRKSGLSLNHIQGCPLDCAYCIRHTYGLWDQRQPRALMSDAEAVAQLVSHRYFQPHVTPLQLFNRATDPFLPVVRPHTFAVLEDLDGRGLRNHVLVITRHQMKPDDADRLNRLSEPQGDVAVHLLRHRRPAHRAVPVVGGGSIAEAHERTSAATLPDHPVLASAGAWTQRQR